MDESAPVKIPITAELDLHTFQPRELRALLPDYFGECKRIGIHRVRVIHGKGTGALRMTVIAICRASPLVATYETAGESSGGRGATIVH